jgi:DNA polymerase-1
VEAFGYRNVKIDGYEADDVIASITERALTADSPVPVMIVTGDRDIFQLIDEGGLVKVMATSRGITDTKIYDHQAVLDRYGLPPALIPDFYGLKGDTSDNIPGVPGIGDKTASELIQRYGSLEDVLSHIREISGPKRKQNLLDHAENARISKRLATIQRDVELDLDITAEAAHEPDRSRVRAVFREYELRDPLRRLEEALEDSEEIPTSTPATAEVTLPARLRAGRAKIADIADLPGEELWVTPRAATPPDGALFVEGSPWSFAVAGAPAWAMTEGVQAGDAKDTGETKSAEETKGVKDAKGAWQPPEVIAGDCENPGQVAIACGARAVVVHDAKALGVVPPGLIHDTLLGAYLLEPARRGYPFAELCEERGLVSELEDPAAADVVLLGALADWQREQIAERGLGDLMRDIELPLVAVLRDLEILGVRLNLERLDEITGRVRAEIDELEREIFVLAKTEFLIASPQQLGEILFEQLGLSRKRKGKVGYSTDARVLQAIREEHEIVPKIERWRELSTFIKTYLDVLPGLVDEHSRLHTTFLQAVAQTGRLSSTNPNMQNVPIRTSLGREIRGCFEAEPGKLLISADYSQIELRVLAHAADDSALKEIFRRGEDVHTATASQVFQVGAGGPEKVDPGMRSKSKMINYGIVYGLSDYGLADRLNIPREEAKEFIDTYLKRFPQVARFITDTIAQAKEEGHVKTLWGRRRQIPELQARNYQVRTLGERLAVNTVIQGTAADIIKLAMVRTHAALAASGLQTRLILTIHDELLFEGLPAEMDAARELIEREMIGVWDNEPPLAVDIGVGENWLAAK